MAASIPDLFSVQGLVCLVTGGGSGLGRWIAEALDENGAAKVFILGRRAEALQRVADGARNSNIIPIQCDVTSHESLTAAVSEVGKRTPFINLLISSAGMLGAVKLQLQTPFPPGSIEDVSKYMLETHSANMGLLTLNIESVHWLFAAFLPLLHAGNTDADSVYCQMQIDGQFITISSLSGLSKKTLTGHMYDASKAGVIQYTRTLSHDFAYLGIRVNTIAPGYFITEMNEKYSPDPAIAAKRGGMPKEHIPAQRTGTAEDIAGTVLYLASRAGAFVNGVVLNVDGGSLSVGP